MIKRPVALPLVVAASLGLSACGLDGGQRPDPIEIVSHPMPAGDPISLDIPLDDSGAFTFDQWPSACELIDEATLLTIFPQADEIAQSGTDRTVEVHGPLYTVEKTVTIPEMACDTAVGFPFQGLRLDDEHVMFLFDTEVTAAGTAEFVHQNSREDGEQSVQIGDATCFATERMYNCALENIAFRISVDARTYGQYLHEGSSAYVVDGEAITYSTSPDGSESNTEEFSAMVAEKVLLPVVTAAVERLSPPA